MRFRVSHSLRQWTREHVLHCLLVGIASLVLCSISGCFSRNKVDSLCHAAATGDIAKVKSALNAGVAINGKSKDRTALHFAARNGCTAIVDLLLSKGAKIEARDKFGKTPLHLAVMAKPSAPVARILLKHGASTVAQGAALTTPLHEALRYGEADCVDLLLEYEIPFDVKDGLGMTPLHIAAIQANENVCRKFIQGGANLNIQDNEGKTPLHYAAKHGATNVIRALLDGGADKSIGDEKDLLPKDGAKSPAVSKLFE